MANNGNQRLTDRQRWALGAMACEFVADETNNSAHEWRRAAHEFRQMLLDERGPVANEQWFESSMKRKRRAKMPRI